MRKRNGIFAILRLLGYMIACVLAGIVESATTLHGLAFLVVFLCVTREGRTLVAPFLVGIDTLYLDILFGRALGTTGMLFSLFFLLWCFICRWSRWRFLLFFLFGWMTIFGIFLAEHIQRGVLYKEALSLIFHGTEWIAVCFVLAFGWIALRVFYVRWGEKEMEVR